MLILSQDRMTIVNLSNVAVIKKNLFPGAEDVGCSIRVITVQGKTICLGQYKNAKRANVITEEILESFEKSLHGLGGVYKMPRE